MKSVSDKQIHLLDLKRKGRKIKDEISKTRNIATKYQQLLKKHGVLDTEMFVTNDEKLKAEDLLDYFQSHVSSKVFLMIVKFIFKEMKESELKTNIPILQKCLDAVNCGVKVSNLAFYISDSLPTISYRKNSAKSRFLQHPMNPISGKPCFHLEFIYFVETTVDVRLSSPIRKVDHYFVSLADSSTELSNKLNKIQEEILAKHAEQLHSLETEVEFTRNSAQTKLVKIREKIMEGKLMSTEDTIKVFNMKLIFKNWQYHGYFKALVDLKSKFQDEKKNFNRMIQCDLLNCDFYNKFKDANQTIGTKIQVNKIQ